LSYTAYGLQKYSVWSLLYSGATKTKYMVLKGAGFLHALLLEFVVDKHSRILLWQNQVSLIHAWITLDKLKLGGNKMSDFGNTTKNDSKEQKYSYHAFGSNLKALRKKKGLNARDLARFIGKTPSYVGQLESGERKPSIETLMEICKFFDKSPDFMLTKPEINSALSRQGYSKPLNEEAEKQKEHREMVLNMLDTFEPEELDHLDKMLRSFKDFTYTSREKYKKLYSK